VPWLPHMRKPALRVPNTRQVQSVRQDVELHRPPTDAVDDMSKKRHALVAYS
jgi:hypothetical protein